MLLLRVGVFRRTSKNPKLLGLKPLYDSTGSCSVGASLKSIQSYEGRRSTFVVARDEGKSGLLHVQVQVCQLELGGLVLYPRKYDYQHDVKNAVIAAFTIMPLAHLKPSFRLLEHTKKCC